MPLQRSSVVTVMFSAEQIRKMLEDIFNGISTQTQDIAKNITMSPEASFGSDFWGSLLHIGAVVVMPFAITLLCFFMAMEFYTVYVKSNGELDLMLVMQTVVKFIIPFVLIAKTYDLIEWIFRLFNTLILNMSGKLIADGGALGSPEAIDTIMETVNKMNWLERTGYYFELMPVQLGMQIMGIVIFVIIYGRIFEIMLFWIFSPLPFATLIHSEHHQIGINYLKLFISLIFQGALMFACVAIYAALVKNVTIDPSSNGGFAMLGYSAVLVFCLLRTGTISKRMIGTF